MEVIVDTFDLNNPPTAPIDSVVPSAEEMDEMYAIISKIVGDSTATTASAIPRRRDIGARLAAIDRSLKQRLHVAADAALKRALERAGNRIRSRAKKDSLAAQTIATTNNRLVASVLGPALVAALTASADLLDDAWTDFADEYDVQTKQSQEAALAEIQDEYDLDDEEIAALRYQMDGNRDNSKAWLIGAMASLAAAKLYHPLDPAAQTGEVSSSLVPFSLIREAISQAGGQITTDKEPMMGLATGVTIDEFLGTLGVQPTSYEWVYGAADRKQPFSGHEDLDGVQFTSWFDDVLLVNPEDSWLDTPYYFPSDHDNCMCDVITGYEQVSTSTEEAFAE